MATFIIRIDATPDGLRGYAEHVRSGEQARFTSVSELIEFLRQMSAGGPRGDLPSRGTEDGSPPGAAAGSNRRVAPCLPRRPPRSRETGSATRGGSAP